MDEFEKRLNRIEMIVVGDNGVKGLGDRTLELESVVGGLHNEVRMMRRDLRWSLYVSIPAQVLLTITLIAAMLRGVLPFSEIISGILGG
ncbi:MAG: hypothetical protein ACPG8W_21995 [Candidatus Promineifilaceae bacterium]